MVSGCLLSGKSNSVCALGSDIMLLVGRGVSTRELGGLGGGVSTCIRSPRPNTSGTADASVAGRAGGELLARAMAALDALGGSCGCRTLGGTSDDIAAARPAGRETADAPRAGGGLGTLFANGTAVGGMAVGPMVGKDLDAPGGFGALLTAGMGRGAAGAAGDAPVTCPCLGALRCGRGGTFGGGGGASNGATFGNSSSTATTLCASEMLAAPAKCLPTRHTRLFGFKELDAKAKSLGVARASKTQVASGKSFAT